MTYVGTLLALPLKYVPATGSRIGLLGLNRMETGVEPVSLTGRVTRIHESFLSRAR